MLIGTPNAGSLSAFRSATTGFTANAVMPSYNPMIVGTMPSIYQLLPRGRHGAVLNERTGEPIEDLLDFELWLERRWGLAGPDTDGTLVKLLPHIGSAAERREVALDHLRKCLDEARRFHAAIDLPADAPSSLVMQLFAGDGVPTPQVYRAGWETQMPTAVASGAGDGTVLRSSALMDERVGGDWVPRLLTPIRWDNVTFIATDHMSLTRHPTFTDNALYLLLEKPRPTCKFRRPAPEPQPKPATPPPARPTAAPSR